MNSNAIRVGVRLFDRNPLKAFADVSIDTALGEITTQGFRVLQSERKQPWVAFPQTSYVKNGQTVNKTLLDLTRSQQDVIANAVLAEYRRRMAEGQGELPVTRKVD